MVVSLCRASTLELEFNYLKRKNEVQGLKPKDVGVSPYLTLDKTGNLEKIFLETIRHKDETTGDVGGSI